MTISLSNNYIKIGFISKPHGIKGEVKVFPLTDEKERFKKLKKFFILKNSSFEEAEIERVKITEDFIICKINGYDSIESSDILRNQYIFVERADAAPLSAGEFYTQDLEGCSFWFKERFLGKVAAVINEGSCDIFIVADKGTEVYFPFLKELVEKIDIENKKIFIKDIEGYFE